MSISATYVSSSSFSVSGDRTPYLRHGMRVLAIQGIDGSAEGTVQSVSYSTGTDTTVCTLYENILTSNLSLIRRGVTYSDTGSSNIGIHTHTGNDAGGHIPAAGLSQAEIDSMRSLPAPTTGDSYKLLRVADTEDGYEIASIGSSGGDVSISHPSGAIDIALNPIHLKKLADVADVVTDAGEANDIMVRGSTEYTRLPIGNPYEVLRVNASGNLSYDQPFVLENCTAGEALSHGDIVFCAGYWYKGLSDGLDFQTDVWGVVVSPSIPDGGTGNIQLFGLVSSPNFSFVSPGALLYLSPFPGGPPTETPPTNKYVVGHVVSSNTMFFYRDFGGKGGIVDGVDYGGGLPIFDGKVISPEGDMLQFKTLNTSDFTENNSLISINWAQSGGITGGWNEGGGIGVYKQTDEDLLVFRTLDSTQFSESNNVISYIGGGGGGGGGGSGDGCPPQFRYRNSGEITIVPGRYFRSGHRLDGCYQDFVNNGLYWDISAPLFLDVDAPGTLIGGDVPSSWYSVFLTSSSTALVLPFIRAKTVVYSDPNTIINPANHDDGTTANNAYISTDDCFNNYRLLLISDSDYHGKVYTIVDSVDGTPDQILISGDVSGEVAATEWLQMLPPADQQYLYLGSIRFDSSGNIVRFWRTGWQVQYAAYIQVAGILSTTEGNTDLGPAVPPTAKKLQSHITVNAGGGTSAAGVAANIYSGTEGANLVTSLFYASTTTHVEHRMGMPFDLLLTAVASIRNKFLMHNGTTWVAATEGFFRVCGYSE